jgi:two-component system, LytTR family, response regulator
MIQAIIIDDEQDAIDVLKELLAYYCPNVQLIGEANTAIEGLKLMNQCRPDIIFLDVQMPNGNGFDFIDANWASDAKIILTTAHPEFAVQAIKKRVFDYLLKPIDDEELVEVINKFNREKQAVPETNVRLETKKNELLHIPTLNGIQFIEKDLIKYVKSDGNYATFYLEDGSKVVFSKNLKCAEDMLQFENFFRLHNSYIVNLNTLAEYKRSDGGCVILKCGKEIPISRRRKDEFLKRISFQ